MFSIFRKYKNLKEENKRLKLENSLLRESNLKFSPVFKRSSYEIVPVKSTVRIDDEMLKSVESGGGRRVVDYLGESVANNIAEFLVKDGGFINLSLSRSSDSFGSNSRSKIECTGVLYVVKGLLEESYNGRTT